MLTCQSIDTNIFLCLPVRLFISSCLLYRLVCCTDLTGVRFSIGHSRLRERPTSPFTLGNSVSHKSVRLLDMNKPARGIS